VTVSASAFSGHRKSYAHDSVGDCFKKRSIQRWRAGQGSGFKRTKTRTPRVERCRATARLTSDEPTKNTSCTWRGNRLMITAAVKVFPVTTRMRSSGFRRSTNAPPPFTSCNQFLHSSPLGKLNNHASITFNQSCLSRRSARSP
jgi:hypothetical protein